jgi:hypothetical protein
MNNTILELTTATETQSSKKWFVGGICCLLFTTIHAYNTTGNQSSQNLIINTPYQQHEEQFANQKPIHLFEQSQVQVVEAFAYKLINSQQDISPEFEKTFRKHINELFAEF